MTTANLSWLCLIKISNHMQLCTPRAVRRAVSTVDSSFSTHHHLLCLLGHSSSSLSNSFRLIDVRMLRC